jgi:hypothetical protein
MRKKFKFFRKELHILQGKLELINKEALKDKKLLKKNKKVKKKKNLVFSGKEQSNCQQIQNQ